MTHNEILEAIKNGVSLAGANLYCANLYCAYLYDADLSGANLSHANLYYANLSGANLRRTNIYGADLGGANMTSTIGYKDGGIDPKGFHFRAVLFPDGPNITAGCRNFTVLEAKEHWKDNPDALARVALLETLQ